MSFQPYSVLIPHVFMNIPDHKIVSSFEILNLGKVEKIDSVIKQSRDGYYYKMVFVHFYFWNMNNLAAKNLREKIENPNKEARLVYDDPWYWLLLPNKSNNKNSNYQLEKLKNIFENQIKRIENEVDCIYEELFQREYIPNDIPSWANSPPSLAPIHPLLNEYDETLSVSSANSSILTTIGENNGNLVDETQSEIERREFWMERDEEDSINYNESIDTEIEYYYENKYMNKKVDTHFNDQIHLPYNRSWMTENICDNA